MMDVDNGSLRCGSPFTPSHEVDLGTLLQIAYDDPPMTVEEDLGLGVNYTTLHKRSFSAQTGVSPNEETADASSQLQIAPGGNTSHPNASPVPKPTSIVDAPSTRPTQSAKNRKRREKRQKQAAASELEATPLTRTASERTRQEHVQLSFPVDVNSTYTVNDMPAMNGAYKAQNEDNDAEATKRFKSLEDFLRVHPDFKVINEATPILDSNKKVAAVLCGQPDNAGYREAADEAFKVILQSTESTQFKKKESTHRRGGFPALNIGVTYGIGHDEPKFLKTEPHTDMLWNILNNRYVQRLARFGDSTFQLWQPKVYNYYAERLEKLWTHRPDLKRIFGKRSVFPCAAFNFARNVWCYKHRDVMNCPFGFCSITALGNFDATKGGHLILWEFKMVIEFPHGSTILVPSATITHSNIPVQAGDVRLSFTQFCAGGLFQYIDNGFSTEVDLKESDPTKYREIQEKKPLNWEAGLKLIATMDDVKFI